MEIKSTNKANVRFRKGKLHVEKEGNEYIVSCEDFRKGVSKLLRETKESKLYIPVKNDEETRAVVQLSYLANYRFEMKKEKEKSKLKAVYIKGGSKKTIEEEKIISEAVARARDIVNMPPNIATPRYIAEYAKKLNINASIYNSRRFPLLDAVGKGSKEKPLMLIVKHIPNKNARPIVLVGKGITYDSGGYGIKHTSPFNHMRHMKTDMSGGASVIHAVWAAKKLRIKQNVIGIIPLAENMISGGAYRIDDVIRSYKGKTVEIVHTDAEGRLVLADALELSQEFKPRAIIDIATLTGAALYATGSRIAPVMGNDKKLVEALIRAGAYEFEKLWQLPLEKEYDESLKSEIADVKNLNESSMPGSIIGGLFLQHFVGKNTWAHIDIGMCGFREKPDEETLYGANAFGTRTLIRYIINGYNLND